MNCRLKVKNRGFTLIELMVAISITAVLGTIGIAGFVNYNKVQVLQTSTNEVVTMLNLAKSRAQSQIKPSCTGDLKGYFVKIVPAEKSYALYFRCSNEGIIGEQNKKLPFGLSFVIPSNRNPPPSEISIFFPIQTGGVVLPADGNTIVINSGESSKTITINALGGVSVQ